MQWKDWAIYLSNSYASPCGTYFLDFSFLAYEGMEKDLHVQEEVQSEAGKIPSKVGFLLLKVFL